MKADIVVDIETVANPVTQKELEEYMKAIPTVEQAMADWTAPSNYKDPAKIEAKRAEAYEKAVVKFQEATDSTKAIQAIQDKRRFSIGGKRMVSCAFGVADPHSGEVENIEAKSGDDLVSICQFIAGYLNQFPEKRLVGFNHLKFDLPEIIKSFKLTGVKPPGRPFGTWDVIDLSRGRLNWGCGLKELAVAFGLTIPETDGSAVAGMYERGEWNAIEEYNKHDVLITGKLYLASTAWVAV